MPGPKPIICPPLKWIPSLYVAEGVPYAMVSFIAVLVYSKLGLSNALAAQYASALGLPWVLKPLWGPLVEIVGTRRGWIWLMELLEAGALAAIALFLSAPHFVPWTVGLFLLLGIFSATHDVAADGFYLLALPEYQQAGFSGVRNTFFRVAIIIVQGGLVILVAKLFQRQASYIQAWHDGFLLVSGVLFLFGLYHAWVLPRPQEDVKAGLPSQAAPNAGGPAPVSTGLASSVASRFFEAFVVFFKKPRIVPMIVFLLLYRLGEAQLVKIAPLFLMGDRAQGGLGLSQEELGLIYGAYGVIALLAGGLLGGWVISKQGLKFWLWPMLLAIHLPDAVFIWLAHAQPSNLGVIGIGVVLEQFGYGFGFSAFMLYMIYIARGSHQTSHYAICTGFMALGMMLPGMVSGRLQQFFGYEHFFLWVLLATIPSFIASARIPLDKSFGRKHQ